jgi:hypothetical protein
MPALLSACIYVAFQVYYCKRRLDNKLGMETLIFVVISYFVMRMYRHCVGYTEGMSTFGETCPNGYVMVNDPAYPVQPTCVPVGHQTASAEVGFSGKKQPSA